MAARSARSRKARVARRTKKARRGAAVGPAAQPVAAFAQTVPAARSAARWRRLLLATDDRAAAFAAGVAAALVLVVALPLAQALNIWMDEAFTLHSTGAGIGHAAHEAIAFEAQPPLYFLLEAAWRTLNEGSIAFARFPSTIFAAAAVAVIVAAAHRMAPRVPPVAVALVTAFNPMVVWAATEMRVYALVFLIASILTWMFFEAFLIPAPSRRARAIYVIFAIAGLYTQYYIGFALVAHALTLLVLRRSTVRAFAVSMAITALGFVPFVGVALDQFKSSAGFVTHASLPNVAHELVFDAFAYIFPHELSWAGTVKLAGFALAFFMLALVASGRPVVIGPARGIMLMWLLQLGIFILLFSAVGLPPFVMRHIILIAPASLLIALIALGSLTRRERPIGAVALATFAVFAATAFWMQYPAPIEKPGDWQRVAATLASEPSVPIAVFPAELTVPISTYLAAPLIAIPKPMIFSADYINVMGLNSESQVASVLDPVRSRSRELWLVTTGSCPSVPPVLPDYHCGYLQHYLTRHYRVVKTIAFRGSLVALYARMSDLSQHGRASDHVN